MLRLNHQYALSSVRSFVVASARSRSNRNTSRLQRRFQQSDVTKNATEKTDSSGASTAMPRLNPNSTKEELTAYLHQANAHMEKYHETRELLRQGKLASKRQKQDGNGMVQLGVVAAFLVLFFSTPFLGKKIAQDEEFRKKYIPKWYDFTVPKPENPWTRQELHEQMVAVEKDMRERAIRGEFTAEKLQEMQRSLYGMDHPSPSSNNSREDGSSKEKRTVPGSWDRIHPGLADDEE